MEWNGTRFLLCGLRRCLAPSDCPEAGIIKEELGPKGCVDFRKKSDGPPCVCQVSRRSEMPQSGKNLGLVIPALKQQGGFCRNHLTSSPWGLLPTNIFQQQHHLGPSNQEESQHVQTRDSKIQQSTQNTATNKAAEGDMTIWTEK